VQAVAQAGTPTAAAELKPVSAAMAQRLALFGADVVVPITGPRQLVGLLLLGGKGDSWVAEELELLRLLAHHVAVVLEDARLFEAATVDSLTGLLRREAVLEQLDREWQRAVRYGRPLAVAMADVDFFKPVNDRYGHLVGDAVLKRTAWVLSREVRSSDIVGRYGGESSCWCSPKPTKLVPGGGGKASPAGGRSRERAVGNRGGGADHHFAGCSRLRSWKCKSAGEPLGAGNAC
jgi:GGDEF domain-containing protein